MANCKNRLINPTRTLLIVTIFGVSYSNTKFPKAFLNEQHDFTIFDIVTKQNARTWIKNEY